MTTATLNVVKFQQRRTKSTGELDDVGDWIVHNIKGSLVKNVKDVMGDDMGPIEPLPYLLSNRAIDRPSSSSYIPKAKNNQPIATEHTA